MDSKKRENINKIAIFYGHVASNLGDLAINAGELLALKKAYPCAEVTFIALHVEDGPAYVHAQTETACVGESSWIIYRTSFHHALNYISRPVQFLVDCGVADSDLIILASGEHLFAYEDNTNIRSLYWRTLPALAAKTAGKRCLLFPSTFGPYETEVAKNWIAALLNIVDGYAVREMESADFLRQEFSVEPIQLPDPAFFISPAKIREKTSCDLAVLGLVMRAEDWGIRLPKNQRIKVQESEQAVASTGLALEFLRATVHAFISKRPSGQVRLFVQTEADLKLAEHLLEGMQGSDYSTRLQVVIPESISDYLSALSDVDALIASRFHALIMGLLVHVPVYGVYFPAHGHKIPGLFRWLNLTSSYGVINDNASTVATVAIDRLFSSAIDWLAVDAALESGRKDLCDWLKNVPGKECQSEDMFAASLALGELAKDLIHSGYEQEKNAQKEKVRSRLEGEFDERLKVLQKEADAESGKAREELLAEFRITLERERSEIQARYERELESTRRALLAQHERERDASLYEISSRHESRIDAVKKEHSLHGERLKQQHELLKRNSGAKLKKLQADLDKLSAENVQLRQDAAQLRGQLGSIYNSTSYQMAAEIARTVRSRRKLFSLPLRLYAIYSEARSARSKQHKPILEVATGSPLHSSSSAIEMVKSPVEAAAELMGESKALSEQGRYTEACEVANKALQLNRSEATLRSLFWAQQNAGRVEEAFQTVLELQGFLGAKPSLMQKERLDFIRSQPSFQLNLINLLPERAANTAYEPIKGRLAYVLHNSLPFSSGGYATRAQGLAKGLVAHGHEVIAFTRPGYPFDVSKGLDPKDVPEVQSIDGITYVRTFEPSRKNLRMQEFIPIATDMLAAHFKFYKPEAVVAASNYICALPALFAARRLGLPFVYEVRGFWEITRLSREPGFINHASYKIQELMEAFVCNQADKVLTLTEAMRVELVRRGVDGNKIEIVPNACQPELFEPRVRHVELAQKLGIPTDVPVIGYIGTFVDYEGLDDLAKACGHLKERGYRFRLLLVGNENVSGQERGPIGQAVLDAAAAYGFIDWLIMPGRVPHEEVADYYSLIDIAPFPRKPWPVCEMVSPMKPLEAMAMEKVVVVSSVSALAEMVGYGEYGVIFEKGSELALADALAQVLEDPTLRHKFGKKGREYVLVERAWLHSSLCFSKAINYLS